MIKRLFSYLLPILLTFGLAFQANAEMTRVLMKTTLGEIELELDGDKAPLTVENFLRYVDEGFYSGTIFHRVINGFMIQGGGFTADLDQKRGHSAIKNEAKNGLSNSRGTIAMARTNAPHSATSQFFINHKDNSNLDYPSFDGWGYAVFGKVTKGLEIVDKIADVTTTDSMGMQNVPASPVIIESVTRIPN
ncbi:MAG: peptidyl-prolyl cis-trans isomerase [Sedimenticola thiotaurini]|uniref:Peptidyl-prolyl cis-trans isomerase n=1 Tax=Sedimenticola thiotaurini TaxID=1543721 RepID=A0A558D166_9GAMM|nr:MAG: peptidyl-prolyl cis-trans isomerase [Sedimenticola thiotaurini]